jgi:hypothetical protein
MVPYGAQELYTQFCDSDSSETYHGDKPQPVLNP